MRGKLPELHCNVLLVSNCGEKVMKRRKIMEQICPITFLACLTFSPGLENNQALKWCSDSFPPMMTYILCVENCQNYILIHSCLPIAGRLFQDVWKFHGHRITECNIQDYFQPMDSLGSISVLKIMGIKINNATFAAYWRNMGILLMYACKLQSKNYKRGKF